MRVQGGQGKNRAGEIGRWIRELEIRQWEVFPSIVKRAFLGAKLTM